MKTIFRYILPVMPFLLLVSCMGDGETVSKREYDALDKAYKELRDDHKKTQGDYIKNNEEMTAILAELAAVTGKTSSLKSDVEKGKARLTQAEQISDRITALKERLAKLEKEAAVNNSSNKTLKENVKQLMALTEKQEQEISTLKDEILQRDQTISSQKDTIARRDRTISSQKDVIEQQNEQLQQTVARQAVLIFQAAVDLEELGDQAPEVKWKKNKEKVEHLQETIYQKALEYYKQAESQGYTPASARIPALEEKINN